jgi:transcriptional regulator of met regulon
MKTRTAIIAIILIVPFAAWSNYWLWQKFTEPTTVYQVQVIERTVVDEVLTTLDLEELRDQINNLKGDLNYECLLIIERHTGDPLPGIQHLVDRHYNGDACKAAEEAARGHW